ncbi:MAG TPA: glycosyltransferase [Microbacterium sp.]|uniref:glycosyltransferase n=1 Tax=Microbacterium sp. TaxID=51671 RepID=UPI002B6A1CCE|nr:glycosyltransferase [Microbacterium sp.]HWI30862.1 glycosyltransferase [Microbacterium sp.]
MHIVMFGDQHVETLGGAQVSMRLQRDFLERAGHTVTIVAPRMQVADRPSGNGDPVYVDTPSIPITPDREYSLSWPGTRTDRFVDAALEARPPVDVVHVQADFWGAFTGHRFARRHGLPTVHTMHNRVDVGIAATAPFPGLVLRALNGWRRRALPLSEARPLGHDGWAYLQGLAAFADAVTAPSSHFASRLEAHGVFPHVDVIWNGIDDDVLDAALAADTAVRAPGRPRFVWLGRMSPEKRLLPFLEAVAESRIRADVEVIGGGGQEGAARRLVERLRPEASIDFTGRLPYAETLRRIAAADAVVQTSIGFETQGMTVFEAASLGTPAIVCDPDIGQELGSGYWPVGDDIIPDATTHALAHTLRRAVAEIAAGTGPRPDPAIAERFRQSSRTAAMVEIYRRVSGA